MQKAAPAAPSVDTDAIIKIAEAKAREMVVEAKDEAFRIRRESEDEARRKLEAVDRREGALDERDKRLQSLGDQAEKRLKELEAIKQEQVAKLERAAHLTREEAKTFILAAVRDQLKEEIAHEIKEARDKAKEEADAKAKEILIDAMRHGATDYVPEYTVSVIKITDEEMKGRIIGKEGRNIRSFEQVTGVDVDLDEEGVIRLSCFDPVRREIARITLERLLRDGRVQPGRIEELVEQVKKELDRIMFEEGQKLCHAVGVYNLPAPLVAHLGKFKYRFSYGQNMIAHTLEETKIGIALAQEIKADVNTVRLGCLLHDIGKVIMDKEGSHVELGVELLRKYGMPQKVTDCVAQHHEDTPFTSIESILVYVSDAISGSRPGARYENHEDYIKRLTDLEAIAKAHKGVMESFAFQAGRELRVVVDPGAIDDATATIMASEIKKEVEAKLTYPGQIKISVIRELRAVEVAK
ncbi:ribonuclease Y [Candidatus Gottesmanbacteria bacterium RIFCSPLOWO2_01_FULL_46_9]|uniref:Ribonuclease Y n=1 Tax=Candidatus Gottesmanbacteria bacterium RIFCSPLOWO2_01_FULL_46_9 TaxID=1798394 RepID=A0A1F6B3H9_9BACT|nr:MAG: ribonuclease Y [Candidatus Gottesmanbacteria bacterium RIFCSPLOWO2_01_FULL_46_9]